MTGKLVVAALMLGALVYGTHGTQAWTWLALLAVLAVLAGRLWLAPKLRLVGGRQMVLHTHGGHGPRYTAEHEAGHYVAAKAIGARVDGAVIRPDGSGTTYLTLPRGCSLTDRIAVDVAGEVAEGSATGCGGGVFGPQKGSDHWYRDQALASVPSRERAAAKRAGYARARELTGGWWPNAQVSSVTRRLLRDGEIRG